MTIKEDIASIIQEASDFSLNTSRSRYHADQILDLILNRIVIERKSPHPRAVFPDGEIGIWNECVDQLEEIKNKLRE